MKTIVCNNHVEAGALRSILEGMGVESAIYDETNSKTARGIMDQTLEVMVNDADYDRAMELYHGMVEEPCCE